MYLAHALQHRVTFAGDREKHSKGPKFEDAPLRGVTVPVCPGVCYGIVIAAFSDSNSREVCLSDVPGRFLGGGDQQQNLEPRPN